MRTLLGWIVLIVGLLVLGLWGRNDFAKDMEAYVTQGAQAQIGETSLPVSTRVSGRDIIVSGTASTPEEKASILAVLDETDGRRVVVDELKVLPTASPYLFKGTKNGDAVTVSGNAPTRDAFSAFLGDQTANLDLAAGMPDGQWPTLVQTGLNGLNGLKNGTLDISDKNLKLSGLAGSLQEADTVRGLFATLPDGYTSELEIEIEPKVPYIFNGTKTADGSSFSGYIPSEAARAGFADVIGAAEAAKLEPQFGAPEEYDMLVGFGTQALSQLTTGSLKISDNTLSITGETANPGVEEEIVSLLGNLPDGYETTVDLTVKPIRPYTLSAQNTGEGIRLNGYAPNVASLDQIAKAADTDATGLQLGAGEPDGNWGAVVETGITALKDVPNGRLQVTDRVVALSGSLSNPEIYAGIENRLQALPDGYSANLDDLTLETQSPYTFEATNSGGVLSGTGYAPSSDAVRAIGGDLGSPEGVTLAAGAPDGWNAAVSQSLGALRQIDGGKLTIQDQQISLSGTVANPDAANAVRASMANLPAGFTPTFDLKELDDGKPVSLSLDYTEADGGVVSGKLPAGLDLDGVAKALGVPSVAGQDVTQAQDGDAEPIVKGLQGMSRWLPFMESAKATVGPQSVKFDGVVLPGSDLNAIERSLETRLGASSDVNLNYSALQPKEGEERVNNVSGRKEVFRRGFWLPIVTFTVSKETCEAESAQVLESAKVNFITGSAELDPDSLQTVNALASVLLNCVGKDGLKLEIGGHTDSQGSANANAQLSLRRAAAVVNALIDRGVTGDNLIAKGYGESQPIASNDTAEGRAENRRTTLTWITE